MCCCGNPSFTRNNGTCGFTRAGVATPAPVGSDEQENSDFNAKFVMNFGSNSTINPYDDIVSPLTVNDLLSPLTINGSLQIANAVLADNFSNITATIIAKAIHDHIISGPGTPYMLTSPAPANDPWGKTI